MCVEIAALPFCDDPLQIIPAHGVEQRESATVDMIVVEESRVHVGEGHDAAQPSFRSTSSLLGPVAENRMTAVQLVSTVH